MEMRDHSGGWTLANIATVAAVSRRVDKYVLLHLSQPPDKTDLEAIRNAGVQGLAIDVGAAPLDSLQELKTDLLEMPRQRPRQRGREAARQCLPRCSRLADALPNPSGKTTTMTLTDKVSAPARVM